MKVFSTVISLVMLFGILTVSAAPQLVLAQDQPLVPKECADDVTKCNFCALMQTANNVINLFFQVLIIVAVILVVIAGFRLVTSGGDVSAMTQAKSMLTNVIIGFVIILSAWLIVDTTIKMLVGEGSQFGMWNEFSGKACGGFTTGGQI